VGIDVYCRAVRFASGTGFLISRDLVREIILLKKQIKYPGNAGFVMDDVSIGDFIINYLRVNITPGSERQDLVLENILDENFDINLDCYHFYFKHTIEPMCLYKMHKKIKEKSLQ